jgi:hypothetical protein
MENRVTDLATIIASQRSFSDAVPQIADTAKTPDILTDYYRCPSNLLRFLPTHQPKGMIGYFQLDQDTICYGRLADADAAGTCNAEDVLRRAQAETEGIRLPFDPGEVVENLRRERYTAHYREEGHLLNTVLRKLYYVVRPYLSVPVRRHLQKIHLRGWDKIRFPAWPVDCTVERIHQKLLALAMRAAGVEEIPFIWFWPDGFKGCAIITHDVEDLCGRDFCPQLMDLDESFGFRSSFQVVPEKRYPVPGSFLDNIVSRGFEVNVHDLNHDGRLYANHAEFLRRAKRINHYAREFGAQGFRSGILYRNADWYDAFRFSYDMSIPNVAHLDPQRGGGCTVMPHFIGKIVELPLTCTQDYTLFNILGDYSIELWKWQVALVSAQQGLISFVVHPDYVIEAKAQATYKMLLGYLAEMRTMGQIWSPLPRDVAAWWRQRSQMELVFEHGEWRVEGAGKERARIAYASLAGETVSYSLTGTGCLV